MQRFEYPRGGERRLRWLGLVLMTASAVIAVTPSPDLLGRPIPPWAHALAVALAAVMGVRFLTWARARRRSDDPAVLIDGGTLRLHIHPGRPLNLTRADVTGVGEIERNETMGQRSLEGDRCFRIRTTATGPRTMDLRIGDRMVDAPLEQVRDAVAAFAPETPRTMDDR